MTQSDGLADGRRLKIGLLGGSFDPPHVGHLHMSRTALTRFGLDRVVWLVSPGNPLKVDAPASLSRRVQAARVILDDDPRLFASDYETRAGTRYTVATLAALQADYPRTRFTWLMGADNLAQIHQWRDWNDIFARMPVGVVARPGHRLRALNAKAARVFASARLSASDSWGLGVAQPPRWCFVNMPLRPESSTALRSTGAWLRGGSQDVIASGRESC